MRSRRLEVVPDSERVEQRLLDASEHTGFVDARGVCTLGQLVDACEPTRWSRQSPAEPLLVRALIAEHAHLAARAYGPVAQTADFAAQAQQLIAQLRAQAVTSRQLSHAAQQAPPGLSARAGALAELWQRVDAALAERGLVDRSELVRLATERLAKDGLPPRLLDVAAITVRFVHELFPARLRFLEALATACHRAGVAFELSWPASGEPATDVFLLDAVRQVEARWQALDAEAFADVPEAPLAWLGAAAFATHVTPRPTPELSAFSAATPRDEAKEIARRVKALVSSGTPPEAIAVVFRDLAADTERLAEALGDVGVPARARLGQPLPASPVGRLALSLLELADDDFPAEAVASLLESRYVALLPADAAEPRRAFAEAGVRDDVIGARGDTGGFEARLASYEARTARESAGEAKRVRALKEAVARLLAIARGVPPEAPAMELLESAWDALTKAGLLEASRRPEPRASTDLLAREVDRALARDQSAVEALGGLLAGLKEAFRDSGLGRRVLRRRDFVRWLRSAAAEVNLVARGPRTGAVWLLDAREVGGRHFEHVFLGGLVDGRFPGRPTPQPLLSEAERGVLNQLAGAPLFRLGVADGELRLPLRLAEDRLLLHLVLSSARVHVTVSRARLDDAGRELLASPFLDALRHAVSGLDEVPLPRAPLPSLEDAATEGELRARAALEVLGPASTRQTPADPRRDALAHALASEAWLRDARALAAAETERLGFFSDEARAAGAFSGQVEPPPALLARLDFPAERPVSAAELNAWGQCAFRGLGLYVLGLEGQEAAGEEPDARTNGTFLHAVLERLVPALDRAGLLGRADADLAAIERHAHAAIDEAAAELEGRAPTGHPELWALHRARSARQVLRLVREVDVVMPFGRARVEDTEVRFGEGARSGEGLERVVIPGAAPGERDVHLRGRIDRVDVTPERTGLLVSDFQLPFYLWAMRQRRPGTALAGAWVGIKKPKAVQLAEALKERQGDVTTLLEADPARRAELAKEDKPNLPNAVHGLLAKLRRGDFGARPTECRYCELKAVCRISARQLPEDGR